MRAQQTENFYKSLHMLQANTFLRESDSSSPFEDYSIFLYRQSAPDFGDRVKDLERKLLYPVRVKKLLWTFHVLFIIFVLIRFNNANLILRFYAL